MGKPNRHQIKILGQLPLWTEKNGNSKIGDKKSDQKKDAIKFVRVSLSKDKILDGHKIFNFLR